MELEAQLGALHAHVAQLEEELGSRGSAAAGARAGASEAAARAEAAEARVRGLEAEVENLGKQVEILQVRVRGYCGCRLVRVQQLGQRTFVGLAGCNMELSPFGFHPPTACSPLATVPSLQERVGRGEYNAATTRVLHFKFNPEAELAREARDARLAELESENEALRNNIQRLEAAAATAQVGRAGAGPERGPQPGAQAILTGGQEPSTLACIPVTRRKHFFPIV